jgi:hypothetical protein
MKNLIEVLPETEKYKLKVVYMMVECLECSHRFGLNPRDNFVRVDQMICEPCALRHLEEN